MAPALSSSRLSRVASAELAGPPGRRALRPDYYDPAAGAGEAATDDRADHAPGGVLWRRAEHQQIGSGGSVDEDALGHALSNFRGQVVPRAGAERGSQRRGEVVAGVLLAHFPVLRIDRRRVERAVLSAPNEDDPDLAVPTVGLIGGPAHGRGRAGGPADPHDDCRLASRVVHVGAGVLSHGTHRSALLLASLSSVLASEVGPVGPKVGTARDLSPGLTRARSGTGMRGRCGPRRLADLMAAGAPASRGSLVAERSADPVTDGDGALDMAYRIDDGAAQLVGRRLSGDRYDAVGHCDGEVRRPCRQDAGNHSLHNLVTDIFIRAAEHGQHIDPADDSHQFASLVHHREPLDPPVIHEPGGHFNWRIRADGEGGPGHQNGKRKSPGQSMII